jgi:hypothetical protein
MSTPAVDKLTRAIEELIRDIVREELSSIPSVTTSPPPAAAKRSELATPQEVAEFRRTTVACLAQERYKGTGPRFLKLGKRVFYDWAEVYAWIDANAMTRTDDPQGGQS